MTIEMPSRPNERVPYRERRRDEEGGLDGRREGRGRSVGHNSCTLFTCVTAPQQRHYEWRCHRQCRRARPRAREPVTDFTLGSTPRAKEVKTVTLSAAEAA